MDFNNLSFITSEIINLIYDSGFFLLVFICKSFKIAGINM